MGVICMLSLTPENDQGAAFSSIWGQVIRTKTRYSFKYVETVPCLGGLVFLLALLLPGFSHDLNHLEGKEAIVLPFCPLSQRAVGILDSIPQNPTTVQNPNTYLLNNSVSILMFRGGGELQQKYVRRLQCFGIPSAFLILSQMNARTLNSMQ